MSSSKDPLKHRPGHCGDFIKTINDYVDGELTPELCEVLERHLCECEDCRVVVDTLKKTIELYQETSPDPDLPEGVKERLYMRLNLDDFIKK